MNELQLPPAPPLPDEVRERVLRTVLAGTKAPGRRFAPLAAAVAAVVATLALTTSVALTGVGGPAAQQENLAPHGDPAVAEELGRCVAAVNGSELREQYPPTAEWRITGVLPMPNDMMSRDAPGTVLVINDSFACHADDTNVSVSMVGGRPAGAVQIAPFGFQIILFNPQRIAVEVGLSGGSTETSAAPVQIISLSPYAPRGWAQRIVVPGSFDGPPPELESPPIQVRDRPRPEPSPEEVQEARVRAERSGRLTACLMDQLSSESRRTGKPDETVLDQDPIAGAPAAVVGRVADTRAAVCYAGPGEESIAAAGDLDPGETSEAAIVTSLRRDGLVVALLTVGPLVDRVEIATTPQPGSSGSGARCTVKDGLALCMLRADGQVDVRTTVGGGTRDVLPIP
ncbi:protein kinase family protein [Pseudonocardia sp. DLS-67]